MAEGGSDMQISSSWRFESTNPPGFANTSEYRFKREIGNFSFGNCSVSGSLIAVGANNASSHRLILIDFSLLEKGKPSIRSSVNVAEEINYTKWVTGEAIVCASGNGGVQVFRVTDRATAPSLTECCTIRNLHNDSIRELAIHPTRIGLIAAGGNDRSITITDLTKLTLRHRITGTDAVGSIKWRPFLQGSMLSVTVDSGNAIFYDIRQNPITAAARICSEKTELFAHERIDNYGLVLGYGDGEMRHYDIRNLSNAYGIAIDPVVKSIGSIEMNDDSQAVVTSGKEGISVWKIGKGNVCMHYGYTTISDCFTSATFNNQSQVLASTSLTSLSWATLGLH